MQVIELAANTWVTRDDEKLSSSFYRNSMIYWLRTYLALIQAPSKATYRLSKPASFPVSFDRNRSGPIRSGRREGISSFALLH
jgi:hypothetical protein